MIKLLVVDDEIASRDNLICNIMKMEFDIIFIEQADDGVKALVLAARYSPDIVLTDVRLPHMDGMDIHILSLGTQAYLSGSREFCPA